MYKIRFFLFVGIIIISNSCSNNTKSIESTVHYNIDVRNGIKLDVQKHLLSDFAKKLTYIPLETKDSCLLSNIVYLDMTKEAIFVSDGHSLYQFDLHGKFIRQISRKGRGPKEHGRRIRFRINDTNKEILLFSYPKKMLVFDMNSGEYKRSFNVEFDVADFEVFTQNRLLFFTKNIRTHGTRATLNEVYLTDGKGNIINSIIDENRSKNRNNIIGYVHLYKKENDYYYMVYYQDIMYRLDSNFVKKAYVKFDFDNKVKWEDLIVEPHMGNKLEDFISIGKPLENENYFFISVQVGIPHIKDGLPKRIIYNKLSKQLFLTEGLENDIDKGMIFWPDFIINNRLIQAIPSSEIIKYTKRMTSDETNKLYKLGSSLNEEDNPVICIAE